MGKGGESSIVASEKKSVSQNAAIALESCRVASCSLEELQQYAAAYGLPVSKDRNELITTLNPYIDGIFHKWKPPHPIPLEKPNIGLNDIRNIIPKELFFRDAATSSWHLISDVALILTFYYWATYIDTLMVSEWCRVLLWLVYIFFQGTVFTGVWVIAHECGHQAFSDNEKLNNFVGLICHSALLVPYHSWRISHGKHHNNTGSCEHDEVFCPTTRSSLRQEFLIESPVFNVLYIILMLTVGWIPGYLVFNATGPEKYKNVSKSHFNPWAKLFDERDFSDIIVSDIFFFIALSALVYGGMILGFGRIFILYGAPYMVCNVYLVLITYLQHTDTFLPHFRNDEWSWFRGALCTVDRSFGSLIDHTIHHIADTHVCHHLFSKIPFYNAQEASNAIVGKLGKYYLSDTTPILEALWRSYTCCGFIEDNGSVLFYKNKLD